MHHRNAENPTATRLRNASLGGGTDRHAAGLVVTRDRLREPRCTLIQRTKATNRVAVGPAPCVRSSPPPCATPSPSAQAFPRFVRYGANAERAHPTEPHWYLVVLSVRPEAQRRGLGSRLVAPGIERADAAGLPCYLETSDAANVAFHQRYGFEVTDPALQLVPDGPTHVAMRRAPR